MDMTMSMSMTGDMGGMSMSMMPTSTMDMSMPSASSSAMAGMDMGGMGGMDMTCKMSMLLNYYTVGTCFISETWYNSTVGMYAGSLIGVFFLTMAIEGVRRLMREYDRRLVKTLPAAETCKGAPWGSQVVRGILYGGQFTAAFIVMLMGMYFNVPLLICIFIGQTAGFALFGRDTATIYRPRASPRCC